MKAATREPERVHKRTIQEFNYVSTSLILASNLWAVWLLKPGASELKTI